MSWGRCDIIDGGAREKGPEGSSWNPPKLRGILTAGETAI